MSRSAAADSFLRGRFANLAARPGESLNSLLGLKLEVVGGYHKGVSRTLGRLELSVGSDPADDLSVFAEPIAAGHFKITRRHPLAQVVRISAEGGELVVAGGERVERHAWVERDLPTTITANGVELSVARSFEPPPLRQPIGALAVLFAVAWLGVSLAGMALDQLHLAPNGAPATSTEGMRLPGQGMAVRDVDLLNDRLKGAGLTSQIAVTEEQPNVLVASGSVTPAEANDWRGILKWFDGSTKTWLVNKVDTTAAEGTSPAIASVWFDAGKPQVQLSDRDLVEVGDTFGDGWLISAVDRGGVEMTRNGKQVKLAFGGGAGDADRQ